MVTDLLVEKIEDGERLIAQLARERFDVAVGFWVKVNDEDLWRLNLASASVDAKNISGALRTVYGAIDKIPRCVVVPSEITLLSSGDPVALDAIALRDRGSDLFPRRFHRSRLANMTVESLFVYQKRPQMKRGNSMKESCFVVMAIGDQTCDGQVVKGESLKKVYLDVIKEALIQARPALEVTRSDDVPAPGTITADILTHLMHSTFVVADITHPNPNVFYELGIRHACKPGTILIRDANASSKAAFDVSHQRYFEYHNTPTGVKELAARFRDTFDWFDSHVGEPDNQLLSLAKLTKYSFPQFGREMQDQAVDNAADLFAMMLANPDLLTAASDPSLSQEEKQKQIFQALARDPKQAKKMMKLFFSLGMFGANPE